MFVDNLKKKKNRILVEMICFKKSEGEMVWTSSEHLKCLLALCPSSVCIREQQFAARHMYRTRSLVALWLCSLWPSDGCSGRVTHGGGGWQMRVGSQDNNEKLAFKTLNQSEALDFL